MRKKGQQMEGRREGALGLTGGVDDVARLDPRRRGGGRGPLQREGRDHAAAPLALDPQPGRGGRSGVPNFSACHAHQRTDY